MRGVMTMKQHKNLLTKGTLAAAVLAMVFAGTAYAADTATVPEMELPKEPIHKQRMLRIQQLEKLRKRREREVRRLATVPLRPGLIR